jgi:hypothetical protein
MDNERAGAGELLIFLIGGPGLGAQPQDLGGNHLISTRRPWYDYLYCPVDDI